MNEAKGKQSADESPSFKMACTADMALHELCTHIPINESALGKMLDCFGYCSNISFHLR